MKTRLGQQRLLALFAAGLLAFNFPLLALWDVDATLWGLPLFPGCAVRHLGAADRRARRHQRKHR